MAIHRYLIGFTLTALLGSQATVSSAQTVVPVDVLQIPLFSGFDNFGNQFETIQIYGEGANAAPAFGIYDTGASVVTLSVADRESFASQGYSIPLIPGAVAGATAVGGSGTLTGDVSQPGAVTALPFSAFSFDTGVIDMTGAVLVPGIQMFVGSQSGSPVLPTITGTPIHNPSGIQGSNNEFGIAAKIEMLKGELDLSGIFPGLLPDGLVFATPEISFVAPGSVLAPNADTYFPVDIPVRLYGENTVSNPGNVPSVGFNPVVDSITAVNGLHSSGDKTFLFDTGAQLSIISTEMAISLGLDIDHPDPANGIDVQGASGTVSIPGFTIEKLQLPRTDGGILEFDNVPIYVLDIGEGLDGILGMNLFNGADSLLYDPTLAQPIVSVTFLNNRLVEDDEAALAQFDSVQQELDALIAELAGLLGPEAAADAFGDVFALTGTSRFGVNGPIFIGVQSVPEPSAAVLATMAIAGLFSMRRRFNSNSSQPVA